MAADTLSSGRPQALPEGVVTFLFSDIEGSTKLLDRLGDGYADVLSTHQRLLRECFTACSGHEVDTEGDAFFVAFGSPSDAVAAAVAAQKALDRHPWPPGSRVLVRMGLHAGEPLLDGDHYVGMDVHRAARICSAAHGGQVLVSARVGDLVEGRVPDGVRFRDLGQHRLKDLPEPQRLLQLDIDGLRSAFPPVRSLRPPTNLPHRATPLVGRRRERRELGDLLRDPDLRLVTVTGPGGVGKTRLAGTVALDLLEDFPHGSYLVDLAEVEEGSAVLPSVARVLGVPLDPGRPAEKAVAAHIADKRMLLFLDNFEQVRDGSLPVAGLLEQCAGLSVLVTSRRLLALRDEHEYALPPMSLPRGSSRASVAASEAVELFVERARGSGHGFDLTEENAGAVATVCTLLDGLPLAIELAAARTRLFSPQALVTRLGDRLRVLTTGASDLPERHRTLRATVEWSYGLLTEAEARFFLDLAVFSGGVRPESIEAVVGEALDWLDLVTALVDHSLVNQGEDTDGEPRITMLQTIRDYALERLSADPDHHLDLRRRHAQHYSDLAVTGMPPGKPVTRRAVEQVARDHDNVRAALAFWLEQRAEPDPEAVVQGLRLAATMGAYWYRQGRSPEGIRWLEQALSAAPDGDPATKAVVLRLLGQMKEQEHELDDAAELLGRARQTYRELADPHGEAECLTALGSVARSAGMPAEAERFLTEALSMPTGTGGTMRLGPAVNDLALVHLDQGEWEKARSVLTGGEGAGSGAAPAEGDERPAVLEAVVRFLGLADVDGVVETIEASAGLAAARGEWTAAARLLGAAEAARRRLGIPSTPAERARLEHRVAEVRRNLGTAAFLAARNEGAALSHEEATSYVIREVLEP